MINSIHRGGIFAILFLLALVVPLHIIRFYVAFVLEKSQTVQINLFDHALLVSKQVYLLSVIVILVVQAFIFGALINRHQFFETSTFWPFIVFLMFGISNYYQIFTPNLLLYNFVFLYSYHRIFRINEDEMSDYQIFMDLGTAFGIGVLIFPDSIYLLPIYLLAINQFAVFDVNRLLLYLVSFSMIVFAVLCTSYLFFSKTWMLHFYKDALLQGFNISDLTNPLVLYPLIVMGIATLVVLPPILSNLNFMPNQNKKIFNVMLIHLVVGVLLVLASNTHRESTSVLLGIPLAFLFTFGSGHLKRRIFANLLMIFIIFALVFIQWVYMLNNV